MRAFLSRMLLELADRLYWSSEWLEELAYDINDVANPVENEPKASTKEIYSDGWPMFAAEPDPKMVAFFQKWCEANGFPPLCDKCGDIWRSYTSYNLRALAEFNDPIPQELVEHLREGVDRGLILKCGNGHLAAGCYRQADEVLVEMEYNQ